MHRTLRVCSAVGAALVIVTSGAAASAVAAVISPAWPIDLPSAPPTLPEPMDPQINPAPGPNTTP
jgi:hypothetical protein